MASPGRDAVLREFDVSRETAAKLDVLVAELARWQRVKNLVSAATLAEVWTRHIADSLQLLHLAPPDARIWVDMGSGAGFPGLPIALSLPSGSLVHLIESNSRKCAFLRHIVRLTDASAMVHEGRLEDVCPNMAEECDVVTARALAPLVDLIAFAEPLLKQGATGLFPKGKDAPAELTEAAKSWNFAADLIPSRTDSQGRIIRIKDLERRPKTTQ